VTVGPTCNGSWSFVGGIRCSRLRKWQKARRVVYFYGDPGFKPTMVTPVLSRLWGPRFYHYHPGTGVTSWPSAAATAAGYMVIGSL